MSGKAGLSCDGGSPPQCDANFLKCPGTMSVFAAMHSLQRSKEKSHPFSVIARGAGCCRRMLSTSTAALRQFSRVGGSHGFDGVGTASGDWDALRHVMHLPFFIPTCAQLGHFPLSVPGQCVQFEPSSFAQASASHCLHFGFFGEQGPAHGFAYAFG